MSDISPHDCLWGRDFFKTYMKHARRMSYNNDILHQAGAISLIGQSLRDVYLRIDQQHIGCRIHPFIIQSSGTGKGSVFKMMKTICRAASIPFEEEGSSSTAGMMGTVKQNSEVRKGELAGNGFIGWKEAQTLLKSADQTHSSDIMEVMNMAMDPDGHVSKALSGGKLEYTSNTSIFCTTYDPEPDGQLELIRQGFLPRTLFFYRTMGESFYDEINSMRDNKVPSPGDNNKEYRRGMESDVDKLANTLMFIEDTVWNHGRVYRQNSSHYAIAEEHVEYFKGVEDGVSLDPSPFMNDILDEYPHSVRKHARQFKTRMMNSIYRLSACFAAADYDEENDVYVSRVIRQKHVNMAKELCKKSFKCTLDFIQDYSMDTGRNDLRELEYHVKNIAQNSNGEATMKELMEEMYRKKSDIKDGLATLEEMGKIESNGTLIHSMDKDDKVKPVQ